MRFRENGSGETDFGRSYLAKVNSSTRITLENNGKIRPQPDRENAFARASGGETGIRTLGGVTPTTVFETAPFDHSGISPRSAAPGPCRDPPLVGASRARTGGLASSRRRPRWTMAGSPKHRCPSFQSGRVSPHRYAVSSASSPASGRSAPYCRRPMTRHNRAVAGLSGLPADIGWVTASMTAREGAPHQRETTGTVARDATAGPQDAPVDRCAVRAPDRSVPFRRSRAGTARPRRRAAESAA